uniref:Uncharacterized protein n=1 Tax=Oryza glumipatula TaxID=40148 RepID=A0A0E0B9R7_9ORYZ
MVRLITATGAPRRRGRRKGRRRHRVPLRLPRTEAATGPTFTPPFRARLGEWAAAAASASARPDNRIVLPSPGTTSLSSFSGDPAGWVSVQCRPRLSPGAAENELQLVDFFQRCHIGRGSQEGTNENLGKAKVSNMRNHVLPKKNVPNACWQWPLQAIVGDRVWQCSTKPVVLYCHSMKSCAICQERDEPPVLDTGCLQLVFQAEHSNLRRYDSGEVVRREVYGAHCQPLKTADLAKGLRDWSSEVILIEEKFRQRREVAKYKKIQVRNSESPVD